MVRLQAGRLAQPSTVRVDSHSVKTVSGGEDISFDGGKKVKGRKRTILVDTFLPGFGCMRSGCWTF